MLLSSPIEGCTAFLEKLFPTQMTLNIKLGIAAKEELLTNPEYIPIKLRSVKNESQSSKNNISRPYF